jgi:hypothetical protein
MSAPASAEEAKARGLTWFRCLDCEYSEETHAALHHEVDDLVMMRSLKELENALTGDKDDAGEMDPRLSLDRDQRDYLQTELLIQMLAELRLIRAALIRSYRDKFKKYS